MTGTLMGPCYTLRSSSVTSILLMSILLIAAMVDVLAVATYYEHRAANDRMARRFGAERQDNGTVRPVLFQVLWSHGPRNSTISS